MSARDITRVSYALLALTLCVVAARARADSELDLAYSPISGCPSRTQTIARIEEQLGRELGEVEDALRAEVHVTRNALGYALTVQTDHGGAHGERAFRAARCEEVHEAAVLVIALSLGQAEQARAEQQQREPEPEPTPPPASTPEPEVNDAGQRREPPLRPKRARSVFSLRAGATLEGGLLPGAGVGTEAILSYHVARSHIEAGGLWLAPKSSDPIFDGSRVEVSLYAGRVNYCHDLVAVSRNQLGMCGGVEVGQTVGKGIGLASSLQRTFLWSAAWVSLRLTSQLLPHFGLVLEPAVGIPFSRPRFVSTTPTSDLNAVLHAPHRTSKRITLGAAFLF